MCKIQALRRGAVASILSFAVGISAAGCGASGSSLPQPSNRSTQAIPICTVDNCGGGGGGGDTGGTPINDTLVDASNNTESINWSGYSTDPVHGVVKASSGTVMSSSDAAVPSATATTMTETVNAPGLGTYQVPLQLDGASPPATESYPNGMAVSQNTTNGTATATQTDANGVTWTANTSINSANTMATVVVTSTAGDSFTKLVPINDDMATTQSKGRAVQSVRATRSWSAAQQSSIARGVAMVAIGILVIGGAPLAAAAIGIAVGVAMIVQGVRGKP